ncbi:L,D-transpeptidase [Bdellovibrionales bacterium]|nr:L,D-transpeptidase [Bdellovibrionales bacterium]
MKSVVLVALLLTSNVCLANYDYDEEPGDFESPHTGNIIFEEERNITILEESGDISLMGLSSSSGYLDRSITYYIRPTRLNVRANPSRDGQLLGALNKNDAVRLKTGQILGEYVELESFETPETIGESESGYYIAYEYLELQKSLPKSHEPTKYFIIQNLATEKLRVYERLCDDGHCAHKMVFETDIVVGERGRSQSVTGYFHITSWHKFYQDGAGLYPSWYDPNYPDPPSPNRGAGAWTKNLPYRGAVVRGAFGWYTAKIGPNSHFQWTHGTIGWGQNRDEFIEATRGWLANLFMDPRSHGCTRTDNESISYLRHLVSVGTPLIKVYAKEAYSDRSLSRYSRHKEKWSYILTKNGVRVDGEKPDRSEVLLRETPRALWIEEGDYKVDTYPTAKPFLKGSIGATSSENGNVYALTHSDMRGVYLIDEGRMVGYRKPARVGRGGYSNQLLPAFAVAPISTGFSMPKCPLVSEIDDDETDFWNDGLDNRCSEEKPL